MFDIINKKVLQLVHHHEERIGVSMSKERIKSRMKFMVPLLFLMIFFYFIVFFPEHGLELNVYTSAGIFLMVTIGWLLGVITALYIYSILPEEPRSFERKPIYFEREKPERKNYSKDKNQWYNTR